MSTRSKTPISPIKPDSVNEFKTAKKSVSKSLVIYDL